MLPGIQVFFMKHKYIISDMAGFDAAIVDCRQVLVQKRTKTLHSYNMRKYLAYCYLRTESVVPGGGLNVSF